METWYENVQGLVERDRCHREGFRVLERRRDLLGVRGMVAKA